MSNLAPTGPAYPEGDAQVQQVSRRQRVGSVWQAVFLAATILAIIVLIALLYNIMNSAFGLVAVQSTVSPSALVLGLRKDDLLSAPNVVAAEDDDVLVDGVAGNRDAIGFFGYSYYVANRDRLRLVAIDGYDLNAEAEPDAEEGYPLDRPLYIYTTLQTLQANPAVAPFLRFYLDRAQSEGREAGFFPLTDSLLARSQSGLDGIAGSDRGPAEATGSLRISGSSTVFPLTAEIAREFQAAGFGGDVAVDKTGTSAGLRSLCLDGTVEIANASRAINQAERAACRSRNRTPVELVVAFDALVVVVHPENDWATNLTLGQLQTVFQTGERWSVVDGDWPDRPIQRFVPGAESGTLDFFIEAVYQQTLEDLPKDDLVQILTENLSRNRGRVLERQQRFYEDRLVFEAPELWDQVCAGATPPSGCTGGARSAESVYQVVIEDVVQLRTARSWPLSDSLLRREEILAEAAERFPDAEVQFRSWLTARFVASPQSGVPEVAGVRTAIFGSLWVIAVTVGFAFPIGVGAAIYLEEYAQRDNWLNKVIQTNINNLAGVPSIIYGLLGLAIFVRTLEFFTSGAVFGQADSTTANGRTILSAGLTLGLLVLPLIIINAQEAIRAVPSSLRQASYGVGASKWQTIWHHVLPNALPGILTGTILAMSRAIGETAPLVVVGASTTIFLDPSGPFSKFTVLPIQIYQWTARPQGAFRNIAAAAILVLLALLLTLNATAVILRNRYTRQLS